MNYDLGYINQINPFSPSCLCSWSLCQQQKPNKHGGMHVHVRRLEISLRCCSVGTVRFILSLTWDSHSYLLLGAGVTSSYTLLVLYLGSPCLQAKHFTNWTTSVQLDYGQLISQGKGERNNDINRCMCELLFLPWGFAIVLFFEHLYLLEINW